MLGTRTRATLTAVLVVLITLGLGAGVGAASGRPAPAVVAAADRAPVRASGGLAVPEGFTARAGYVPVAEPLGGGLRLTRPDGGCSSPWGGTRYGFDGACRAHDLGYDLLRDAAGSGLAYSGAARVRVDVAFWRDMVSGCGPDAACVGVAAVYAGVVALNSASEAFSVPSPGSLHRVLLPAVGALVALTAWAVLLGRRRVLCAVPVPLLLGAAAAAASWQPSMLPRTAAAQVLVTALSVLSALAAGGAAGRLWRAVRGRPLRRQVGPVTASLLTAGVLVGAAAGHAGQVQQALPMGVDPIALWQSLLAGLVGAALAVAAALVPAAVLRRVRGARRSPVSLPRPPRPAWVLGTAVLLLLPGSVVVPDRAAAAPVPDRQQQFLDGGAEPEVLAAVTGRPVRVPVRVAVPVTAGDAQERAQRAVRELLAAGGQDRSTVLVVLPTGSGWVNPAAVEAVELLTAGDVATVTVQYDDRPSYRSFLSGGGARAAEQAGSLLDALAAAFEGRSRPRVVVYGESLGAVGGLPVAHHPVVDGAVWAGVPHAARGLLDGAGVLVEHPDDPVPAWSPRLLVGPTDRWRAGWAPLVSFWAGTGDLIASLDQPGGHGHRYGGELVAAFARVVPTGLADDRLDDVRVAVTGTG